MKYTQNAINVLAARTYKGIGRAWFVKNWKSDLSSADIVELLNHSQKGAEPITVEGFEYKKQTILNLLLQTEGSVDGVVAIGDNEFPAYRGEVKNSERPIFLFYKGDLSLLSLSNRNVAVIGLLNPTPEIADKECTVVAELVNRGATIVSGLALGCDSIAHRTALECKGKTVAILPSPLSSIMPATNRPLAQEILENGGLLVSEYLTDAKSKMALSSRYQERDRLQALFSDSIILSASYAKNNLGLDSGSRLAMGYAADYGIPRGVIYDDSESNNPMFELNRQYMNEDCKVVVIKETTSISDLDGLLRLKPRTVQPIYSQNTIF